VKLILGSGSPRRKTILEEIFGQVEIISPCIDETVLPHESAPAYTERITALKMDWVISEIKSKGECCAVTADTVVSVGDSILGKPVSVKDAYDMLSMLSGKSHTVLTGLSVLYNNGSTIKRIYQYESTSVEFKLLDDKTIKDYISLVNCLDKAGSYAIQEYGEMLINSIKGSYTNVVGFPLRLFYSMIVKTGALDLFY
jgi:septum formation protein